MWVYVDPKTRQVVHSRKDIYVNSRITLAIIVVFSVITFSMIPFQQLIQQNAFAQDDESDTDTEQSLRQRTLEVENQTTLTATRI